MASFGLLRHVTLVRTGDSEEGIASIIRVTRIGELGTTLAVTSNRCKLRTFLSSVLQLLVTVNVVPTSPILVRFMMGKRRYVPPKHLFLQDPHGITSQKTEFLILSLSNKRVCAG
jgi:hypothetical protein